MPFQRDGKRDYKRVCDDFGRECTTCGIYQLWENYSRKSAKRYKTSPKLNQTLQPICKQCANKKTKEWRLAQSPERIKHLYYMRKYGLSFEEFSARWQSQQGKCKICERIMNSQAGTGDSVCVDHCHTTGKVRGLLCNECNRGLGYFRDNPSSIIKAALYLAEQDLSSGKETALALST